MAMFLANEGGDAAERAVADAFGPSHVDQMLRQAIQYCWMCLPKERQSADELQQQIRRLVDRALKDFREDRQAFGKGSNA